jgi:hypothetical protein
VYRITGRENGKKKFPERPETFSQKARQAGNPSLPRCTISEIYVTIK